MGAGVAASHSAPLAGANRARGATDRAALRPRLLSLSRAIAAPTARSTRPTPRRWRLPNDFPALQREAGGEAINESGLIVAEPERGVCQGRLLLAAPRSDAGAHVGRRDRAGGQGLDRGVPRARRARGDPLGADLREPRRHDGGEQSASPLPDLGDRKPAQRGGQGARRADAPIAQERGGCLLCDYLALELDAKTRIVCENEVSSR